MLTFDFVVPFEPMQPGVVVYDRDGLSIKGADKAALNLWFWGSHQNFFRR